tara:strand:- start:3356 stop:3946 length:591 start_codon:yes stop_codon:yes gene_type:complete
MKNLIEFDRTFACTKNRNGVVVVRALIGSDKQKLAQTIGLKFRGAKQFDVRDGNLTTVYEVTGHGAEFEIARQKYQYIYVNITEQAMDSDVDGADISNVDVDGFIIDAPVAQEVKVIKQEVKASKTAQILGLKPLTGSGDYGSVLAEKIRDWVLETKPYEEVSKSIHSAKTAKYWIEKYGDEYKLKDYHAPIGWEV